MINNLIDKYIYDKVSNNVDCRLLWDVLKIEIREATIIYCKSRSKFKREARRSLEKELQDLSSHRDSLDITDESLDKRINDIEKELEQIYNQKAKGAQIRSKEKWVALGEKNNSYFLGLEKQRQVKKSKSKLLDENNKVIKEQGEILNTIKDYYEKLYTSKKTDEISSKKYIFDTKLDKILNDEEKLDCDGEVTDTECSEAIGNRKLNKSPGLDGLTVEFYRTFWGKLKIVLTDIYNKSYNEALMSYSQRSSILSLLFKKGDP